jgi:cell division protein FtsL
MSICRYVCILVVIVIMTIFTMSEGSRIIRIGYNVTSMENDLARLSEENKKLKFKSGKLKRPEEISLKLKDMNLDLIIQEEKDIAVAKKSQKSRYKRPYGKIEA